MSRLFSLRMRAAEGAAHEAGGRHISGAENLLREAELKGAAAELVERAFLHSRGKPDFLQIVIESVADDSIVRRPLLPVYAQSASELAAGRELALKALLGMGVSKQAAKAGFAMLDALPESRRGALLLCAESGKRLSAAGKECIRVSRMAAADDASYRAWLKRCAVHGEHAREALLLASKTAFAPGLAAELCWSDDPEYTGGYVAGRKGYVRLPKLKEKGSDIGGRVFFVKPQTDLALLCAYLSTTPVLIELPEEEGGWLKHDVLP